MQVIGARKAGLGQIIESWAKLMNQLFALAEKAGVFPNELINFADTILFRSSRQSAALRHCCSDVVVFVFVVLG